MSPLGFRARPPSVRAAWLFAGLTAFVFGSLDAQMIPNATDVQDDVDAVFAEYDRPDSPGCALGVIRDGELVYARGYGMANLDLGVPLSPTSVFRIASTSKQFTAAAMVLVEQNGELSLDDDIRTYLPEIPEYAVPVTIRMLLHHTSGIRDYLTLARLAGLRPDDWYTDAEVVELIARQQRTNFEPGTEHLYSNSGYFLLSQILQRATGMSLREYAEAHIFDPLGMTHTHFHDDHTEIVPDRATGYAPHGDGFRISMTTLDMVGDGGVFTSVEDLVAWERNFHEPRKRTRLRGRAARTGRARQRRHDRLRARARTRHVPRVAGGRARRGVRGVSGPADAFPEAAVLGGLPLQPRLRESVGTRPTRGRHLPRRAAGANGGRCRRGRGRKRRRGRDGSRGGRGVDTRSARAVGGTVPGRRVGPVPEARDTRRRLDHPRGSRVSAHPSLRDALPAGRRTRRAPLRGDRRRASFRPVGASRPWRTRSVGPDRGARVHSGWRPGHVRGLRRGPAADVHDRCRTRSRNPSGPGDVASDDRAQGAEAVIRSLIRRGAIGLVTTHDMALAKVADALTPLASNVHFADHLEDGKLVFDYRMRPGVVRRSNALEMMRAVGLDIDGDRRQDAVPNLRRVMTGRTD